MKYDDLLENNLTAVSNNKPNLNYSLQTEQLFLKEVIHNNLENAKNIINDIFEKNNSSFELSLCIMFSVVSALMRTLSEIKEISLADFIDDIELQKRLISCNNTADILRETLTITEYAVNYINLTNSKVKPTKLKIVRQIISFIDKNFYLLDLSVAYVADVFNLNPVSMSNIFKNVMAQSLPDYINYCRIENAKKIMLADYSNLEELAFKVGYNNTKTLTRAFKKYVGMTPGQYKNKLNNREEK